MNLKINLEKKIDYNNYEVTFNENIVGKANGWNDKGHEYHIDFNYEIFELASVYPFAIDELFKLNIGSFQLPIDINRFKNLNWINIQDSTLWIDYNDDLCKLYLNPDFLDWNKSIDILTFRKLLQENLKNKEITLHDDSDIIEEGFVLTSKVNFSKNINDEYRRILSTINIEIEKLSLKNDQDKNSYNITNIFSFPPEVRSVCEQYLIYFSRFLEDLGIEVASKLDSQSETTIFTVIPKNSEEALSNIKELLNTYLKLPETNDIEILSSNYSDISVQQLIANVYHLKSQLMLSNSIIQNKDATIESLKFTNYQQNLILNSKSNQNEEKTLDGLVTLTEYEGKGFKINLAEIFRRLKRQFTR